MDLLIDIQTLQKYDSQKMYKVYDMWPEIAEQSYKLGIEPVNFSKSPHFVFAGMGGSGAIGDIFSSILSKTDTHVTVVKGYHLPKTVTSESLVIVTSVSGNTAEALSILNESNARGSKIIAFSSGGKIEEYCIKENIAHRNIKKFHSPRTSFTSFLYSMLSVLKPVLPINEKDVMESIDNLKLIQKKINSENMIESNPAIKIAEYIKKTPVIYYPWGLQSAAVRFKNSLQENCKIHVIAEDIIEACHNGVVAWGNRNDFQPILIRGKDDYKKTKKLWEIIKKLFNNYNIQYNEILTVDGSILSKLICMIYLLDYTSIYLSAIMKIDPSPVKSIDYVKSQI
jgi:glucose/mannose-6-phosphate isomerase